MTLTPAQLLEGMALAYNECPATKDSDAIKAALSYLLKNNSECEELWSIYMSDGHLDEYLTVLVEAK